MASKSTENQGKPAEGTKEVPKPTNKEVPKTEVRDPKLFDENGTPRLIGPVYRLEDLPPELLALGIIP